MGQPYSNADPSKLSVYLFAVLTITINIKTDIHLTVSVSRTIGVSWHQKLAERLNQSGF